MKNIFIIAGLSFNGLLCADKPYEKINYYKNLQALDEERADQHLSESTKKKVKEAALQLKREHGMERIAEMLDQMNTIRYPIREETPIEQLEKELYSFNNIGRYYLSIIADVNFHCLLERLKELRGQGRKTADRKKLNNLTEAVENAFKAELYLLLQEHEQQNAKSGR